ncbi:MAG: hypothetical protein R2843_04685 [Thermomicrobiales bacterium]
MAAATQASAMPVLPDVGSIRVVLPGVMMPRACVLDQRDADAVLDGKARLNASILPTSVPGSPPA